MSDGTLAHRFEELAGKHVLILGDVMLDRFVYGTAGRISPEAPVPVLSIQRETIVPGGAANVARNVAALGGTATLIGLIGEDEAGGQLTDALEKHPGIRPALLRVKDRPTTRKIRFVADRQQVIRADYEDRAAIGKHTDALLNLVHKHLPEADAVVLSDYAKGLLSERVIGEVIAAARGAAA